jgi:hypothetical protein
MNIEYIQYIDAVIESQMENVRRLNSCCRYRDAREWRP